jgi:hypothetical protein
MNTPAYRVPLGTTVSVAYPVDETGRLVYATVRGTVIYNDSTSVQPRGSVGVRVTDVSYQGRGRAVAVGETVYRLTRLTDAMIDVVETTQSA